MIHTHIEKRSGKKRYQANVGQREREREREREKERERERERE